MTNLFDMIPIHAYSSWREKRAAVFLLIVGLGFPPQPALACIREAGAFHVPAFVIVFGIVVMAVALLTLVAWIIKRLFFPNFAWFPPILVASGLLALLLGIAGSFFIPEFEVVFASFGPDLPGQTKFLFAARHFLWLPMLAVIGLWLASKNWKNRLRYWAGTLVFELILLFLALAALYAPIFKLGCV